MSRPVEEDILESAHELKVPRAALINEIFRLKQKSRNLENKLSAVLNEVVVATRLLESISFSNYKRYCSIVLQSFHNRLDNERTLRRFE